jgi:hypothetical protein
MPFIIFVIAITTSSFGYVEMIFLMSNIARGFLHVYIRSNRPAKTPIGTFEWQLIGARLDSDSTRPYENFHLKKAKKSTRFQLNV